MGLRGMGAASARKVHASKGGCVRPGPRTSGLEAGKLARERGGCQGGVRLSERTGRPALGSVYGTAFDL